MKKRSLAAPVLALSLFAAACGGSEPAPAAPAAPAAPSAPAAPAVDNFPERPIRWIISSSPGGGQDTSTRQLQQFVEAEMGTALLIDNRPGGNFSIGARAAANEPADCYTILTHADEIIHYTYLTNAEVPYDKDTFTTVLRLVLEPGILIVMNDAPWQDAVEFFEDARQRPGQIRVGASGNTDPGYYVWEQLQRLTGVEFTVVAYDGGAQMRNALLGGEIDAIANYTYTSIGIANRARIIAATTEEDLPGELNPWTGEPVITVNNQLGIDSAPSSMVYGFWVRRECAEDFPDRYAKIVDAFQRATENPDYLALLDRTNERGKLGVLAGRDYYDWTMANIELKIPLLDELGFLARR